MSLLQVALNNHRHTSLMVVCAVLSPFALRPESTVYPLIGLLSTLLIYIPFLSRIDTSNREYKACCLVCLLSIGSTIFRMKASRDALSTPGASIAALIISSTALSSFGLAAVYISTKYSSRLESPWSRLTLFPALWATLWCTVAYINPVGHLATWSPADNSDAYNWLAPYFGPVGKDWIVAAWAVFISETVTQWFMAENEGEYAPLLDNPDRRSHRSNKTATRNLGFLLVALLIPFGLSSTNSLPVADIDHVTPISVGCSLPSFDRYDKQVLELDDYIKESAYLRGQGADIILWPEGAVAFKSSEERDAAFKQVRERLPGPYIGVSFEETISDPDHPNGGKSITRTGVALLSNSSREPHLVYYKRHLVPVAESYRLRHSAVEPSIVEVSLSRPKNKARGHFPGYPRALLLSSSICLDFATPSPFEALGSRPSLILAPARTWEPTVGNAMWLQARQRAIELGSMVLWCDGGSGGVSGIAGGGFHDVAQVGQGSFMRTVATPYPFDARRTFYGIFGDMSLLVVWILCYGYPRKITRWARHGLTRRKAQTQAPQPEVDLLGD